MRQPKFRIWDNKYKKLHYKVCIGNVCDEANYTAHSVYLRPGDTDYHIDEPGLWMHFDEHSDIIISQFTGLKDINGIDLYHGDKIQVKWGNYIWEYVISELTNGNSNTLYAMQTRQNFYINENDEEIFEWVESTSFKDIEFLGKFEIIGNIYTKQQNDKHN